MKTLKRNPDNRYQSMEQLGLALSCVFAGDQNLSGRPIQHQLKGALSLVEPVAHIGNNYVAAIEQGQL